MAAIDRNILRLGAYEMLFCPEVPAKVAINEALELAKRYSTAQSSRFVNGILDRVLQCQAQEPSPRQRSSSRARVTDQRQSPKRPLSSSRRMKPRPNKAGHPASIRHSQSGGRVPGLICTCTRRIRMGSALPARSWSPRPVSAWRRWRSPTMTRSRPWRSPGPRRRDGALELIAGVELTCEHEGRELHILGHFIRDDDRELLEAMASLRTGRNPVASRRWPLGWSSGAVDRSAAVRQAFPRATLGRPHLADYLARTGQVGSTREAFARYLGDGRPACVPKPRLDARAGDRLDPESRRGCRPGTPSA